MDTTQQNPPVQPKKSKTWCLILPIMIVAAVMIGFGINKINQESHNTDDRPAGAAKNYQYPTPSTAAQNRQIDCNKLRMYLVDPKCSLSESLSNFSRRY